MLAKVYNMAGEAVSEIELQDEVFAAPVNTAVMHQALIYQQANARLATAGTKTRAEVSGGGRKPWRQKGTGNARQGTIRAPQWRHGGIVFGPTPERNFSQKMPRKMRRLAYRSALTVKAQEGHLILVDDIKLDQPRTKDFLGMLKGLGVGASALVLLPEQNLNVERSANNIASVKLLRAQYLNIRDLLGYEYIIMPLHAKDVIEDILTRE
ncbi:MAG: 50S ribosomal protein L4 [Chloroflexi bacterium]|nr:50S ribosomal protein L4 [Chloroflexota bacterium]